MTEKTLRVRIAAGRTMMLPTGVAMNFPRRRLTGEDVVTVRQCRFIRRRIAKGDLMIVTDPIHTAATVTPPRRTAKKNEE